MTRPFLVLENLDTVSRHELFRFLGTRWAATRFAWLSPVFWCTLGLVVALLADGSGSITRSLLSGLAYGLMLMAANTIHSVGHIVAGRLAGEPMEVNLLTATRDVSGYVRKGSQAPRDKRVARSLGGPVANLAAGALALAAASATSVRLLEMFGLFNLLVGVWTLLPVPSLDGAVIWRAAGARGDRGSRTHGSSGASASTSPTTHGPSDQDGSALSGPARNIVLCIGAVVLHEKRVLLVRQAPGHALAGQWTIPWGLVDAGECPSVSALRETREEAGVEAEIEGLLCVQELPHPWCNWLARRGLGKHATVIRSDPANPYRPCAGIP